MNKDYRHLLGIIRQEKEMVVPGKERQDLVKGGKAWRKREKERVAKEEKKYERSHNQKKSQQKYYRKNKEKLNAYRALKNRTPEGVFYKAKYRAKTNGIEWDIEFEDWVDVWMNAPNVVDPETGFLVTAWSMKGSNPQKNTQMARKDTSGIWTLDNVHIIYKGVSLTWEHSSVEQPRWESPPEETLMKPLGS